RVTLYIQVPHLQAALDALLEGRTAIIIAHRLSTAMRADRIGVVEGGEIVELGSHAQLVARQGRYAEMYATWVSHMSDDDAAPAHNGHRVPTGANEHAQPAGANGHR
ncbi:MAG: hypothetical protein ACRDHX_15940, partial [Chloroflexota bacterium]